MPWVAGPVEEEAGPWSQCDQNAYASPWPPLPVVPSLSLVTDSSPAWEFERVCGA